MNKRTSSNRILRAKALASIPFGVLLLFFLACGEGGEKPERSAPAGPESFTFFDVGRNSRFSEQVRKDLSQKLGNDAVERRSIINLEGPYKGFLAAHLPELEVLNRRLNHPPGERVEHDVIRLMYRYARQMNAPFDYVDLIFDGQSRTPLVFHIRFKADEAGLLEALRAKHGPPQTIDWGAENGQSLVWRKEQDVLMASLLPDSFGGVRHNVTIYFSENLNRWAEFEQDLKEKKSREKSPAGRTAF
jgi:hypothetical protein